MAKVKKCVVCDSSEEAAPLITIYYKEKKLHLCTSHLPLVIHEPEKLEKRSIRLLKQSTRRSKPG